MNLTLDPKALGLADGAATLIVAAQDHSLKNFKGNSVFRELPVTIDTEAPRLDILSTQYNVNRGGVGVVAYRLSEAGGAHRRRRSATASSPATPRRRAGRGRTSPSSRSRTTRRPRPPSA